MNTVARFLLPLFVLLAGAGGAAALILTAEKPERKPPPPMAPEVRVVKVAPETAPAVVRGLGAVMAARSLTLEPEVSGRVVYVHDELVPGGTVKQGEVLVRLDAREHRLVLEERQAQLERARFELEVEEGRGRVARREWNLVGADEKSGRAGKALALREPHLRNAEASVMGAEAAVKRAELMVERTVLRAPFDVLVLSESVEIGEYVTPQSPLASLVGTDEFWAQVSVPVSDLKWVATGESETPSSAVVRLSTTQGEAVTRRARVLRRLGELDPKGRMARVLVSVPDPLNLEGGGAAPLLLGAHVRVEIDGRALEEVFVVPRTALRQDDHLWIADDEDALRIRRVQPVWRSDDRIFVQDGLSAGERVVVSRIAAPVEGMPLRVKDETAGATARAREAAR